MNGSKIKTPKYKIGEVVSYKAYSQKPLKGGGSEQVESEAIHKITSIDIRIRHGGSEILYSFEDQMYPHLEESKILFVYEKRLYEVCEEK